MDGLLSHSLCPPSDHDESLWLSVTKAVGRLDVLTRLNKLVGGTESWPDCGRFR